MSVYEIAPPEVQPEVVTEREQRARTLEAAALEIDVRGWAQGSSCTVDGRTCLAGGIAFAVGHAPSRAGGIPDEAFGPVVHAWGGWWPSPIDWNDRAAKSAEEVTLVLRWRADEVRRGL